MKTLTLENVMTKMLQDQEDKTFASEVIPAFPLLKYKFKGKDWTFKVAYDYLKITMNILGFFNGSKKTYGDPSDKLRPGLTASVGLTSSIPVLLPCPR